MTPSDDDAIAAGSGSGALDEGGETGSDQGADWPDAAAAALGRGIADVLKEEFARRDELEALRAELADLREEVERMRRSGPAW